MQFQFRCPTLTTVGICFLTILILLAESTNGRTSRKRETHGKSKREGSWSKWSPWTSCSRSCGGGIRTQTRYCRALRIQPNSNEYIEESKLWKNVSNSHCEGHSTRHHLCNDQPCPIGTADFRQSQCSSFDNRPFMGKWYQWEAYIDERSPCSLTCRPIGLSFFTTLKQSVIDGTECPNEHNNRNANASPPLPFKHVCISGLCTSIGCDGIAGSQRRFDRCGICGGDNSSCRVISGIFTRPQLPVGYNMVAQIPRGACNLTITQIRKSPNYLALRRSDGTYILNGNWAVSWPGEYDGVGAKFRYTKQDLKSLESISAAGPLREPVDLLVLAQQANPGIKYEYMMPNDAPIPPLPQDADPALQLHHRQRALSAATSRPVASYTPHQGGNTNSIGTSRTAAGAVAPLPQPNTGDPSNSISSFPKTSPGGTASLLPLSYYSADSSAPVSQHPHLHQNHHNHHGRRRSHLHSLTPADPASVSGGNTQNRLDTANDKKFYWRITGYTNCSEPCGGGIQTSVISCVRGSTGAIVPDRKCNENEKPTAQTTIRCNLKPCPAEWITGPWSSCSEACGNGFQTRTVHCQQRVSPTLTMRVSEAACLDLMPDSRKPCFVKPCNHWETSLWSQCSATCGNGIRSRSVFCVNANNERIEASECSTVDKPLDISPCNMGPCDGVDWFFSEWSPSCTEKCGSGVQTRHVVCSGSDKYKKRPSSREIETNEIEDDDNDNSDDDSRLEKYSSSLCDLSRKPEDEKECFSDQQCYEPTWFTSPWSECSLSCGQGIKTRQVLCVQFYLGKFKVVFDSQCSASTKPESKSLCNNGKECQSRWFTSEWSECSAICGGGIQKRGVSCRNSNYTKLAFTCSDSDRPIERRSCNEHHCDRSNNADKETSKESNNAHSIEKSGPADQSGMVKDTPPLNLQSTETQERQQQQLQLRRHHHHHHYQSSSQAQVPKDTPATTGRSNPRQSQLQSTNSSGRQSTTVSRNSQSSGSTTTNNNRNPVGQETNQEPGSLNCTDQYRNCALVVQARLCRYKYYRDVCCISCSDN